MFELLDNMIDDVIQWKPESKLVKRANILIFGLQGAGKSTLLNGIISLWNEIFHQKMITFQSDEPTTLENVLVDDEHKGFSLIDAVGVNNFNYQSNEFRELLHLDGGVSKKVHSIIFVVPESFADDEKEKHLKFKKFINEAIKLKYQAVLVVTKIQKVSFIKISHYQCF